MVRAGRKISSDADRIVVRTPSATTNMREHLTTEQAADYLGVSPSWLAQARGRGDGPPFYKLGRTVRYMRASLDAWSSARQVSSTAAASADSEERGTR